MKRATSIFAHFIIQFSLLSWKVNLYIVLSSHHTHTHSLPAGTLLLLWILLLLLFSINLSKDSYMRACVACYKEWHINLLQFHVYARFRGEKKSDIRIIKIHLSRLASKRCCSFYGPFTVEKKGIDNFWCSQNKIY